MDSQPTHELSRRALLAALGVGGIATVGSVYSKVALSNRTSTRARALLTTEVRDAWAQGVETVAHSGAPVATPRGSTIGFLYIPRLRNQVWGFPIVEGTNPRQLNVGIGHLTQTALPGEVGNVALFGHRTTYGKPFDKFDEIVAGDVAILETKDSWFVYTLIANATVTPDAMWVAKPNPFRNGVLKEALPDWKSMPNKVLSLITCTPKFSTKYRWVWWGTQTSQTSHDNPPSALTST